MYSHKEERQALAVETKLSISQAEHAWCDKKTKKRRHIKTKLQVTKLEEAYEKEPYPDEEEREAIASRNIMIDIGL